MKIGEFAERVGVAPSTLRYYEEIGLIADVPRVNRQRYYPAHFVPQVQFIQISKQAGFTLDEIRDMLRLLQKSNPARATWQPVVERKLQEIEAVITQYQQMHQILTTMLTCDMDKLTLELLMEEDCEVLETSMLGRADCFSDDGCAG